MSFTRSSIEQVDCQVNLLFGDRAQITVFGKELSQEPIEVLVAASLPTVVGVGEVDSGSGVAFQFFEVTHFGAIVECNAPFQVPRQRGKQFFYFQPESFFGGFRYVPDESIATLALHECYEMATVVSATYCVSLPVAKEQTVIDCLWASVNPPFLLELSLLFTALGAVLTA